MAIRKSCILLVEPNPDLHELEEQVLTDAGYQVEPTPAGADPVMVAEQTHPDLIVMGLPYKHPEEWQVIDRLQAAPETRKIPLVVITTSEREAAAAQAAPTARYTVVAPYDISALETAAREALQSPPPAAVLPPAKSPVSPAVSFATDTLSQQARHLVLEAIRQLQQREPYKTRFPELSKGLVDDLGIMMGAIIDGLRRYLPPEEVFAVPVIRQAIERHVKLRVSQGLQPAAVVQEYQALQRTSDQAIVGLINQRDFTAIDALVLIQRIRPYVDELIRQVLVEFQRYCQSPM